MTVGFQAVLVTTQFPVQTAPARIVDIESTHTSADLILNRRRFLGGNWGKQLSRTRSAHARWFPNADVAFMDASRRNAGYGMDGHVDMIRALSVPSNASGCGLLGDSGIWVFRF